MRAVLARSASPIKGGAFAGPGGVPAVPTVSLVYGLASYNGGSGVLNGATVSSIIYPSLTITALNGYVDEHCEWFVDSTLFRDDDLDAPYEMKPGGVGVPFNENPWVADGAHTVTARLYFIGGSYVEAVANVTVTGLGGDPPPPPVLGRPDSSNTGHIAAGVATGSLTAYAGSYSLSSNTTITEKIITGQLNVSGGTVTLNRCRLLGDGGLRSINISGGTVICNDCTFIGAAAHEGVYGAGFSLYRCWISGYENGVVQTDNTYLEECYIDNTEDTSGDAHYDGVECNAGNNNQVVRCTVEGHLNQTSSIMTNNYFGACTNYEIDQCWLSGGGYVFYADGDFNGTAMTVNIHDCVFEDSGQWGYALIRGANCHVTQADNVDINGDPITL